MPVDVIIAFLAGSIVGACVGVVAITMVTQRCYCYPKDNE